MVLRGRNPQKSLPKYILIETPLKQKKIGGLMPQLQATPCNSKEENIKGVFTSQPIIPLDPLKINSMNIVLTDFILMIMEKPGLSVQI